jgi:hypothetical protein
MELEHEGKQRADLHYTSELINKEATGTERHEELL